MGAGQGLDRSRVARRLATVMCSLTVACGPRGGLGALPAKSAASPSPHDASTSDALPLSGFALGPNGGIRVGGAWISEDLRLSGLFAGLEACRVTETWEFGSETKHFYRAEYPAVSPDTLEARVRRLSQELGARSIRRTMTMDDGEVDLGEAMVVRGALDHPSLVFLHSGAQLAVFALGDASAAKTVARSVARQAGLSWLADEIPKEVTWTREAGASPGLAAQYSTLEVLDDIPVEDGPKARRWKDAARKAGFVGTESSYERVEDGARTVLRFGGGLLALTMRRREPGSRAPACDPTR